MGNCQAHIHDHRFVEERTVSESVDPFSGVLLFLFHASSDEFSRQVTYRKYTCSCGHNQYDMTSSNRNTVALNHKPSCF
jgi:hypothetical protein